MACLTDDKQECRVSISCSKYEAPCLAPTRISHIVAIHVETPGFFWRKHDFLRENDTSAASPFYKTTKFNVNIACLIVVIVLNSVDPLFQAKKMALGVKKTLFHSFNHVLGNFFFTLISGYTTILMVKSDKMLRKVFHSFVNHILSDTTSETHRWLRKGLPSSLVDADSIRNVRNPAKLTRFWPN